MTRDECDDCSGYGYTEDETGFREECERCQGTGIEPLSDSDMLPFPKKKWKQLKKVS